MSRPIMSRPTLRMVSQYHIQFVYFRTMTKKVTIYFSVVSKELHTGLNIVEIQREKERKQRIFLLWAGLLCTANLIEDVSGKFMLLKWPFFDIAESIPFFLSHFSWVHRLGPTGLKFIRFQNYRPSSIASNIFEWKFHKKGFGIIIWSVSSHLQKIRSKYEGM